MSPKKAATPIEPDQIEREDSLVEAPSRVPDNPDGRGRYRRQLEQFALLKDAEKHSALKDIWKDISMGAALRAKALVSTCSPKDFSMLYRVVMSGAVALDKAYPPAENKRETSPALVVNMFGTLGQRAARIAMPETPATITVEAQEVEQWQDSATMKTSLLPTVTVKSPTTTPSTDSSKTP